MVSKPHGGMLVNRVLSKGDSSDFIKDASLPRLNISHDDFLELRNLAEGVFSPLNGFMTEAEFNSVVSSYRLPDGSVWTIPVTLGVSKDKAQSFKNGDDVLLVRDSVPVGVLHLVDSFSPSKPDWCMSVYGTIDERHPGVAGVLGSGDVFLGGSIDYFDNVERDPYRLSPSETRELFRQHGWRTIAAFQTRNAPHRAHEYLQKTALEVVDGLLIHPLIGRKKVGDFKNDVIVGAYDVLVNHYYPGNSLVFSTLTTRMHYAGPVEAVHHALMRKNHGCTHFIVGRDHAGVGDYYHSFAAHNIFNSLPDLGIQPLKFDNAFYCRKCGGIATAKTCPHSNEDHLNFSGTKIRGLLSDGQAVPFEIMRSEVSEYLQSIKDLYVK